MPPFLDSTGTTLEIRASAAADGDDIKRHMTCARHAHFADGSRAFRRLPELLPL